MGEVRREFWVQTLNEYCGTLGIEIFPDAAGERFGLRVWVVGSTIRRGVCSVVVEL